MQEEQQLHTEVPTPDQRLPYVTPTVESLGRGMATLLASACNTCPICDGTPASQGGET